MWLEFSFGDEIIDLSGSEGREDCRKGNDETRCTEGIFLESGIKEDGICEHRWSFCGSGVIEGEDHDPLLSRNREGTEISVVGAVATRETDRSISGRLQPVEDLEIQLADVEFERWKPFVVLGSVVLEIEIGVNILHQ